MGVPWRRSHPPNTDLKGRGQGPLGAAGGPEKQSQSGSSPAHTATASPVPQKDLRLPACPLLSGSVPQEARDVGMDSGRPGGVRASTEAECKARPRTPEQPASGKAGSLPAPLHGDPWQCQEPPPLAISVRWAVLGVPCSGTHTAHTNPFSFNPRGTGCFCLSLPHLWGTGWGLGRGCLRTAARGQRGATGGAAGDGRPGETQHQPGFP